MFNPDASVFVIAEVGVNHNGEISLAKRLVDVASVVGADAVKFQTFDARRLVTATANKAPYQQDVEKSDESQQEMLAKLQLSREAHYQLRRYAEERGLVFMSTAFDGASFEFVAKELALPVLKIASGEITNAPLLLEHGKTGQNLILSTGMSDLAEVQMALSVLAFGFLSKEQPSLDRFKEIYLANEAQTTLRKKVTLMHCTTQYPASIDSVNLNAMDQLQKSFGLRVGYSDHTLGTAVAPAAVAKGARVIEKHLTLDKSLPGPDHKASLEQSEFREMVEAIRIVEQSLGSGEKIPHPSELVNRPVARKSVVASRKIQRGERFTSENITVRRPGIGRSPMDYWDLIGTRAEREYDYDDLL